MTWLNAALAFAITMLILSMSTSVIVETIHRAAGLREKGLKVVLERFYEQVVAPYLTQTGVDAPASKDEFVKLMSAIRPALPAPDPAKPPDPANQAATAKLATSPLRWMVSGRDLSHLDPTDFMSRLGNSRYGDAVRAALAQAQIPDPDQALKSIAEEFDAFGREVGAYFERRARLLSVLVAIVVAIGLYVNPRDIFTTYLANPQTAQNVIAMRAEALKRYEDAKTQAKTASDTNAADAAAKQETAVELKKDIDNAEEAVAGSVKSLHDAGTPIGWTTAKCTATFTNCAEWSWRTWAAASTFMWLIIGGFLVGLGGPFWYDMVNSLSSILTLATGAKKVADSMNTKPPGQEVDANVLQPQTPVEHFKAGAAGRAASGGMGDDPGDSDPDLVPVG